MFELGWLAGVGLVSGFLGGMLGIGGGVIIVPALIIAFEALARHPAEEITVIAVATSLACIVFTSASAAYTQYKAGKVRWDLVRRLAVPFVLGSFTAGVLAPALPAPLMRALIGVFLVFVAIVMLTNWRPAPHATLPGTAGSAMIGFAGGNMAGLAGIAGGNVIVPTLVFFNVPVHNATATSSALGVPIAAAGALSYALIAAGTESGAGRVGYVDLHSFFVITLCAVLTAPLGVRMAHRVPAARLKVAFGVLLLFVAGRMLISAARL